MNNMLQHLVAAAQNKHISIPLVCAIGLEIIPIWFPNVKSQCQETQKVLLCYGIVAAANSGPKQET